jgi:hypothetical protein
MKLLTIAIGCVLLCAATISIAHDDSDRSGMASMDTDNDGTVSKAEFTAYYTAEWDRMPKNHDGTVSVKEMKAMHHDKTMSGNATMQGKNVADDKAKQDEVKETDNDGH